MNSVWYKIVLFGLLLILVFAPFAGFAPLLMVILIASVYLFLSSIVQSLIFGEQSEKEYRK